ncbi:TIGR03085 family protein [Serinibacter arcticus]|uniref:TIGR03085 family protein n=1 Tax=Serinibacter arcticus TaxID=1655435 RepID=A0A2U1ZRH6_9MICO|nr:TIGR03085 family metal-binding protein [Serinibacter arcticus]PWD49594.1 TIGR03085 family protein [Serinibacter arcticus]
MDIIDDLRTGPRADLVAALRAARPTDPTLCEGWEARHLAAHVVLRERRPVHVAIAMARGVDPTAELADTATDAEGYARLVDQVAEGPSALSPIGWSALANVSEMLIHAEDVRRGAELPNAPRELPERLGASVWSQVRALARLRYARSASRGGAGVVLVTPQARAVVARGDASVVLTGTALELTLWLSGRERASLVKVTGPDAAVADFLAAHTDLPPTLG